MLTRLLLIEDNPGDALLLREKLNEGELEYELVHADRLKEGLELLARESFDLLFCDLSLPDASGLEAVRAVRKASPETPLIVLTGLDDSTVAAEARSEGAADYFVKWFVDSASLGRYIRYAIDDAGDTPSPRRAQPVEPSLPHMVMDDEPAAQPPKRPPAPPKPATPPKPAPPKPASPEPAPAPRVEPAPRKREPAPDLVVSAAESALSLLRRSEATTRWAADLLQDAIALHRIEGVRNEAVNLIEPLTHLAREHRALSMSRGIPLRADLARKSIVTLADRRVFERLMRRALADALFEATAEGVLMRCDVAGSETLVEVRWTRSLRADDTAATMRPLAHEVLEEQVRLLKGRVERHDGEDECRVRIHLRGPGGTA